MAGDQATTVRMLQERIRAMQAVTLGTRSVPTLDLLRPLLPGGALQAGAAYSVPGSLTLALLLIAGASAAGAWSGVVGVPEFGVEAAAAVGVDLGRLVLVPAPGEQWLPVTAQLADVLPVVLVRPPERIRDTDAARLASRLRQRGASLVVLGPWRGAAATLRITGNRWWGLDAGSGYLAGRDARVLVESSDGRSRQHTLRLVEQGLLLERLPEERAAATAQAERAGRAAG